VRTAPVETARQMQEAVEQALPADIAVMAAAVADWRVEPSAEKLKKDATRRSSLDLVENPDILAGLARHKDRPRLVIGFAAETQDLLANAEQKLKRKGADWIVANDVSPKTGIMGGERNRVHLISAAGVEDWPEMSKVDVAKRLVERIVAAFKDSSPHRGEVGRAKRRPGEGEIGEGTPLTRRLRRHPLPDGERKRSPPRVR
jgi:phosphopantothenoylcysteine decarboxylase/phosphopantothenate--cysteine ligase